MDDVTVNVIDNDPKPKAPAIGEYYQALHVADAAEDLVAAIVQKGARKFPQEAFERLCGELHHFRQHGLPPCPEDAKNPIYWRMLDIETYFKDETVELLRGEPVK